jgi:glycosyltransferase involved in cell wall biosynthesis
VDDPERLLPAADLLFLTSASEGVPGVVIEAGLCAVPSVAFDVGSVASVVADGLTGRIVPFGDVDAMVVAARDVLDHRATFGQRARESYLERYDTQRVVDMWLDLLISVAAPSVDPAGVGPIVGPGEVV